MPKRISANSPNQAFREAADRYRRARKPVALTGAGISVECGIPDFRSRGGLWEIFRPEEYATLDAFLEDPERAWKFYRALGEVLRDRSPGRAHFALARLESENRLAGVITQNIDGLHTASGSREVVEMHGQWRRLNCPRCGRLAPASEELLQPGPVPRCPKCRQAMKPDVVLFGEMVRETGKVERLLDGCDCLLVVGTSAEVFPAAEYPLTVAAQGGTLMEFNLGPTPLSPRCDFLFSGPVGDLLPRFVASLRDA